MTKNEIFKFFEEWFNESKNVHLRKCVKGEEDAYISLALLTEEHYLYAQERDWDGIEESRDWQDTSEIISRHLPYREF